MHRTQIIIEDWQYEHLRIISEEKGKSISSVLRDMITSSLKADEPGRSLEAICGLGEDHEASGKDHDRFLYKTGMNRD